MNKIYYVVIIIGLIIVGYFLFKPKEPQYIQRLFKNGNSINVRVDDSITSDNWDCTGNCEGHYAGYEWAEEKQITEPEDCGGNSVSFIEGCEAYANEN